MTSNTFRIHYLKNEEWKPVAALMPFTYADLLDERLDEANVTVYSHMPVFTCMTVFRVTISQTSEQDDVRYFSLANDLSPEYIPGKGLYRHDLYLIEYTKTLEGILCQSLTFTNSSGRIYTDNAFYRLPDNLGDYDVFPWNTIGEITGYGGYTSNMAPPEYPSLIPDDTPFIFPSILEMSSFILNFLDVAEANDGQAPWRVVASSRYYADKTAYTQIDITSGSGTETISDPNTRPEVYGKDTFSIKYSILFRAANEIDSSLSDRGWCFGWTVTGTTNAYPLKKWTIADAATRCLQLAEPLYGDDTPRFVLDAEDAEKYAAEWAPEFTMTACTLREQLKVIGGYIHAEPRLLWPNVIKFVPLGTQDRALVEKRSVPYTYAHNNISVNEYCTSIRSQAANLVQSLVYGNGTTTEPYRSGYKSVRSETLYARITEGNAVISTQFPIYSVKDIRIGFYGAGANGSIGDIVLPPVSVKDYLFEETEYAANLANTFGEYPLSKAYAIYYTIGSKNIKGLFYIAEKPQNVFIPQEFVNTFSIALILSERTNTLSVADIQQAIVQFPQGLIAQVVYQPIYSALLSHEKHIYDPSAPKFEQIYNQRENLLDSIYFGENMKGVATRLGNPQRTRTYLLSKLSDVPRTGETIDGLSVSGVKTQILPTYIRATVDLTVFNRISEYVGVDSHKRIYEVSERNTYDRSVLLKSYIVTGDEALTSDTDGTSAFSLDLSAIAHVLEPTGDTTGVGSINNALLTGYDVGGNPIRTTALPVVTSALGNAMLFSMAFKDNYSAGTEADYELISYDPLTYGYFSQDVPYADYYGRIHSMHIALSGFSPDFPVSSKPPFELPDGDGASYSVPGALVMNDGKRYLVRKDNRERLSVNIEIEYKSADPQLIVGSAMAYLCGLVNWSYAATSDAPRLYVFKKPMEELGITPLTRQAVNLPTSTTSDYWVHESGNEFDGFTINRTMSGGRCVDFSIVGSVPELSALDGTIAYGWMIATPSRSVTRKVSNEEGGTETITENEGGDVLLLCTKTFVSDFGSPAPNIFTGCKFVFKNN